MGFLRHYYGGGGATETRYCFYGPVYTDGWHGWAKSVIEVDNVGVRILIVREILA